MTRSIPPSVFQQPVEGVNLRPGTLADQVGDRPTLLVFLRHFGWLFCRETVADLRQVAQHTPNYPPILFVYHGNVEDGQDFFATLWPEARAVADARKTLYTAFGIGRAGMRQVLSPEVAACAVRAAAKGHLGGRPQGDTLTLPDLFLVHAGRVLWQFRARHVADHPDWQRLMERLPLASQAERSEV